MQASFDPPGLSFSVKKDRAVESLLAAKGLPFVINVLAAGKEKTAMKQMTKSFKPGEDRFAGLDTKVGTNCMHMCECLARCAACATIWGAPDERHCVWAKCQGAHIGCVMHHRDDIIRMNMIVLTLGWRSQKFNVLLFLCTKTCDGDKFCLI